MIQDTYKKLSKKPWRVLLFAGLFFSIATFTFAQIGPIDTLPEIEEEGPVTIDPPVIDPENPDGLTEGAVWGYGWMGTGITNPNATEGGVGWLKFNCEPDVCADSPSPWGTRVNLDENSPLYGQFYGQAWSNNNGWLDFSYDNVERCWQANPNETFNGTAKILFPSGKVVGWAKFINGDDFNDDGYTGCVSFSGEEYTATVDLDSGALRGWAWGDTVIGWISFQNPECPFCDVTIVLDEILGCTNPLASNYNPLATVDDGSCRVDVPVRGCMDPTATNYNPLATIPGRCIYAPVLGCTNPLATNYNPLATVDDGSCRGGRPTLNLQVTPDVFVLGGSYLVGPITWTSTNPSQIAANSCSGSVVKSNGGLTSTVTLTGWTGARANPNSSISVPPYLDLSAQMVGATTSTSFRFTIRCQTTAGATISDDDVILVTAPAIEPPVISLHIIDPNADGSLVTETINSGGIDDFVLNWQASNMVPNSCEKSSERYGDAPGYALLGANSYWQNGASLPLSPSGFGGQTMPIGGTDLRNTKFQISCAPLNAPTTTVSAQVCMGIDGKPFPQSLCSAGTSINRPPGYKEI